MVMINQDCTEVAVMHDASPFRSPHMLNLQEKIREDPLPAAKALIGEKVFQSTVTARECGLTSLSEYINLLKYVGVLNVKIVKSKTMSELLGVEGEFAARYFGYWHAIQLKWREDKDYPIPDDWHFIGHRRSQLSSAYRNSGKKNYNRYATQPVNAMLNYGYAIMQGRIKLKLVAMGAYPTIGIMHAPHRPKDALRFPLVLDLMEPLRPMVDKVVLDYALNTRLVPSDFLIISKSGVYPRGSTLLRRALATEITKRVESINLGLQVFEDIGIILK